MLCIKQKIYNQISIEKKKYEKIQFSDGFLFICDCLLISGYLNVWEMSSNILSSRKDYNWICIDLCIPILLENFTFPLICVLECSMDNTINIINNKIHIIMCCIQFPIYFIIDCTYISRISFKYHTIIHFSRTSLTLTEGNSINILLYE